LNGIAGILGAGLQSAGILSAIEPRSFFEKLLLPGDPGQPVDSITLIIYSVVIVGAVFLPFISVVAMFSIWAERKVAGHIQSRLGPNRVGPIGILQSIADGVKLILKEDLIPKDADRFLFRLAPYLAFAPVFAAFVALPFGPELTFEPRLNVGVFYVLAVLSVEVMGVILAGWASNNKWSVYGAMREACQMVSYEIPLGISIIVAVMAAGTLNMVQMSHMQGGGIHTWIIYRNPFVFLAFFMYFIASLASNKRAPFDLPESESELVAGFHTEYSGLRFSFFFFAEYAAMFVVGGIQTALFLGSWHDPFGLIGYYHHELTKDPNNINTVGLILLNLIAAAIFVTKAGVIIFVQMWLRWTLPRPRIDQVLYACVKVLLPLACVILLGATFWQLLVPERMGIPWVDYNPLSWGDLSAPVTSPDGKVLAGSTGFSSVVQILLALVGIGGFLAICGWIFYAAVSGRNLKQRLTEPAAIDQAPESLVKA
jgi:NADH-quinone oxidoreductase subunit H